LKYFKNDLTADCRKVMAPIPSHQPQHWRSGPTGTPQNSGGIGCDHFWAESVQYLWRSRQDSSKVDD